MPCSATFSSHSLCACRATDAANSRVADDELRAASMTVSHRSRSLLLIVLMVLGTACTSEPPLISPDPTSTTAPGDAAASPTPAIQSSTETTVARLGSIADVVPLAGRVTLLDEVNVMP